MLKNLAVALTLTLCAAFAGAQTTHHYEATDESDSSAEQKEEPQAEAPAPAPRSARTVPRVFRVVHPGGTRAEPNAAEGAPEDGATISGDGQSQGGQGMGIDRVLAPRPAAGDRSPGSGAAGAPGSGETAARGCKAPAGWKCVTSPVTEHPPIKQAGGPSRYASGLSNVPFDVNWSGIRFVFTGATNVVHVHPIKFDSDVYLGKGAELMFVSFYDPNVRDTVISTEPGSMNSANSAAVSRCARMHANETIINVVFDGGAKSGKCSLKKDTRYYLNVRVNGEGTIAAGYPNPSFNYLITAAATNVD